MEPYTNSLNNGPLEELWRVTSIALDRSVGRGKSTWIPARVPIPPNDAVNQVSFYTIALGYIGVFDQ